MMQFHASQNKHRATYLRRLALFVCKNIKYERQEISYRKDVLQQS